MARRKSSTVKPGRHRNPATLALLRSMHLPEDFPLSPHPPSGRWYRKIRKGRHYFGKLEDPQGALDVYLAQRDDLLAGRKVRKVSEMGVSVADVCNAFLTAKQQSMDAGELTGTSWHHYFLTCRAVAKVMGRSRVVSDLTPEDFGALRAEFAKTCGAHALAGHVQRTRSLFKFAFDSAMIPAPIRFGPSFKRPKPQAMRQARAAKPARMFAPAEVRRLIDNADVPMKAMVLLGINAGLGNEDIARLEQRHLDLSAATLDFPRPKTSISRRACLWVETVAAIRAAMEARPKPSDPADMDLIFITKYGNPWTQRELRKVDKPRPGKPDHKLHNVDSVRLQFNKLCKAQGVPPLGFYSLRHTFSTVAEGSRDFPTVELVMGHEDYNRMATRYREGIDNDRLRAVADHVRNWLGLTREDVAVLAKIG
ncbi:MAG: tyrosine-type recombinase/integrase [Phycisphaeraceae bacterium]